MSGSWPRKSKYLLILKKDTLNPIVLLLFCLPFAWTKTLNHFSSFPFSIIYILLARVVLRWSITNVTGNRWKDEGDRKCCEWNPARKSVLNLCYAGLANKRLRTHHWIYILMKPFYHIWAHPKCLNGFPLRINIILYPLRKKASKWRDALSDTCVPFFVSNYKI